MLQKTFYDTIRFTSEAEAEIAGEIYRIEYGDDMIVTDPDGKTTSFPMNYRPVAGLDVSDWHTLNDFFNKDMEKRDKASKQS